MIEIKTTVTLVFRPDAVLEVSVQEKLSEAHKEHYRKLGYATMELELGIPYSAQWVKDNQEVIKRQNEKGN